MNKRAELSGKDLFEIGFPALVVFISIWLLHTSYWYVGILGFIGCFFLWIKGDKEIWGSMATAFLVSAIFEFILLHSHHIGHGILWVVLAFIVFLAPRW